MNAQTFRDQIVSAITPETLAGTWLLFAVAVFMAAIIPESGPSIAFTVCSVVLLPFGLMVSHLRAFPNRVGAAMARRSDVFAVPDGPTAPERMLVVLATSLLLIATVMALTGIIYLLWALTDAYAAGGGSSEFVNKLAAGVKGGVQIAFFSYGVGSFAYWLVGGGNGDPRTGVLVGLAVPPATLLF